MNIAIVKDKIIENHENIEVILKKLNLYKIKDFGKEYRCSKYMDGSATGICVKKENCSFTYRGRDGELKGDIFTLIQHIRDCKLNEAIVFACECIGIDYKKRDELISYPFGGYYKEAKSYKEVTVELPTYPEDVLKEYLDVPNIRFQKDGINLKVQKDFNIMYDVDTNRIVIPWRNSMGQIVGITGRINDDNYKEKGIAKYYPLISFPKSQVLYGFYENYNNIVRSKMILVNESEKAVLQLRSMEKPIYHNDKIVGYENINVGVSVGCHSISNTQKKMILSVFPEIILICFDEGIEQDYLIETAKQMQFQNAFYKVKVGYIYDKHNKYLPKDSNMSPSDLGLEIFTKLLQECIYWV